MKKLAFVLIVLGLLSGCNKPVKKENSRLLARLDSMQVALEENSYAVDLLDQVGQYLDSIDAKREWIKFDLEAGIDEDDYIQRMKKLNSYLQKAEWTVNELEGQRNAYISQVKRLKKEIAAKNQGLQDLEVIVAKYTDENSELQGLLAIADEEQMDAQLDMDKMSNELEQSKVEIQNLMAKVQRTKAESFYAQGEGMEEAARRTQFAPRRKKQSLNNALRFFEQSSELGYEPAKTKVDELKSRLKIV